MTSDSSDEENLDLLKEAQDAQFINDSMFTDSPGKPKEKVQKKDLPSLRKTTDDDDQFNFLKVTPEFRNYVAKQLSSILDRKLSKKFANIETPQESKKKHKKGGVKLLADSTYYIKATQRDEDILSQAHNARVKLAKYSNKRNVEDSAELLKEVVVSADDILNKKEVRNWSKRSKAPVFRYKRTKTGQLTLIES